MLFILLLLFCGNVYLQDLRCSKEFCEKYLEKNDCPKLPKNCNIQNATHNGLILPFAGPCNCCKYCVENVAKGKPCASGDGSSQIPQVICGDGLTCNSETKKCETMNTPCSQAQRRFDKGYEDGTIGHLEWRPSCNRNGEYETYSCIPGEICFCTDENGHRIFGEIPFTPNAAALLSCGCSRAINTMEKFFGRKLRSHEHLRCQSDGSYDPIQCIGEKCMCVDVEDGAPSDPDANPVNITIITKNNLPCFMKNLHEEYIYYRRCESKSNLFHKELQALKEMGYDVFGSVYPNCQLDGYYAPVQYNKTHKYCADIDGNVIENFAVSLRAFDLTANMNCKCARVRALLKDKTEKPVCCKNGNYMDIQCRKGLCRCVDEDGNQIGKEEKDRTKLNCNKKK